MLLVGERHDAQVQGNFHFSPGKSYPNAQMHVHDLVGFASQDFNVRCALPPCRRTCRRAAPHTGWARHCSHTIHKLTFGESYPGAVQPLDGTKQAVEQMGGMYMYYTKVVPTSYVFASGDVLKTNQYSVTRHFKKARERTHARAHPLNVGPAQTDFDNIRKGLGLPGACVLARAAGSARISRARQACSFFTSCRPSTWKCGKRAAPCRTLSPNWCVCATPSRLAARRRGWRAHARSGTLRSAPSSEASSPCPPLSTKCVARERQRGGGGGRRSPPAVQFVYRGYLLLEKKMRWNKLS